MTVREGYEVRVTVNCVACDFAVFDRWSAPGHLFDGSDQRQESFIVSGDASISLVAKSVLPTTICIPPSRFNENFTLSVEGRGTSVDPYYAGEVFMGHEVTSPPNEPVLVSYEYTGPQLPPLILSPGGYKSQDSSGHTCNYETEVWLAKKEVLNELYPRLDIMEHETVTHIATSNVGWPVIRNGALFTDNHDDFLGSVTLAQQPVDPVTGCRTSPGIMSWLYDIVEIPIGYSYFGNDAQIDCASGRVTVEHKFKPMLTLTLESKGEQGYAVASPAKKYYAEPFEANPDYEEVTITARPLPGFGFTHWEGDIGGATISGVKGEIITVTMDKYRTVIPHFTEAKITDFKPDMDKSEETRSPCTPTFWNPGGLLMFYYEWQSTTGHHSDLDGKIIEVLCYDPSVTVGEMIDCLESDRAQILAAASGTQVPCTADVYYIDPIFIPNVLQHHPTRFEYNAHSPASKGFTIDGNAMFGPCSLSCTAGSYSVYQSFFHIPNCGDIYRVGGPYEIKRSSAGDLANISVEKHGTVLSSGCGAEWTDCSCP